jgi:hypothetical protein
MEIDYNTNRGNAAKNAKTDIYIVNVATGAARLCSRDTCVELPWIVAYRGGEANDTVLVAHVQLRSATNRFYSHQARERSEGSSISSLFIVDTSVRNMQASQMKCIA